jgi:Zn-dependent protease
MSGPTVTVRRSSGLSCPACGVEVAPSLLSCPGCQRLIHADRLKLLAAEAEQAVAEDRLRAALVRWREALTLLPSQSRQHAVVLDKIEELSLAVEERGEAIEEPDIPDQQEEAEGRSRGTWAKVGAGAGAIGLLVWKLKWVVSFILTKGKLLLLGLGKSTTIMTMLASFGLYWTVFGWTFALGLVLSIYVHEMGHVAALRNLGIRATAPMFIPGFGAVVRLKQYPASPREDARVGLAGPLWGLAAAVVCYLLHLTTEAPFWGAMAQVGAFINLFNLLPVWQLDGSRAFVAMTSGQRWLATASLGAMYLLTGNRLLILLLIFAGFRALISKAPGKGDNLATLQYVGLVIMLSVLTQIEVGVSPL